MIRITEKINDNDSGDRYILILDFALAMINLVQNVNYQIQASKRSLSNLLLLCNLEYFLEGVEGVLRPDWTLLVVAQVVVSGHQDLEGVWVAIVVVVVISRRARHLFIVTVSYMQTVSKH